MTSAFGNGHSSLPVSAITSTPALTEGALPLGMITTLLFLAAATVLFDNYGQIFLGFFGRPNVFGSAEVNSRTDGLNAAH